VGAHGLRPAALGDGDLAMPARHEFRRGASCGDPFLSQAVAEDRGATAQGLYAAVVAGLVLGFATIACGPLYRALGGEAYGVMALLALVGTASAVLLMRRWRAERVVDPIQIQPQSAAGTGMTVPEV
jgi:hypothetical protein